MKTSKLKYPLIFALAAFSANVFADATYYEYKTANATDIDWSQIVWSTTETKPTENRDKYTIDLTNSTTSNIHVRNGAAITLTGALYTKSNAHIIIGDDSKSASSLTISEASGKDVFVEVTGLSSITVKEGATFKLESGYHLRYWSVDGGTDGKRVSFLVDGGTFIGGLTAGYTNANPGVANIEFINGASFKSTSANTLNANGIANILFDASTLETYNSYDSTASTGWRGNAIYFTNNLATTSTDKVQVNLTFDNGSYLNAGGSSTGTYYDFAVGDMTTLTNGSTIDFRVGNLNVDTNYMNVSVLNGSKASAANFYLGSTNMRAGKSTFTVKGNADTFAGRSEIAIASNLNFYLSEQYNTTDTSLLDISQVASLNFEGFTKFRANNVLSIGSGNALGGTVYLRMTGDKNDIAFAGTGDYNINGGNSNNKGLASEAKIRVLLGKDEEGNVATNSTFSMKGPLKMYAGGNSDILWRMAGSTNTFTFDTTKNVEMTGSSYLGGNSKTVFETTDGAKVTVGRFGLNANASGETNVLVTNGAELTAKGIAFGGTTNAAYADGVASSSLIIDSAKFYSVTSNFDLNYNNISNNATASIILKGSNSVFSSAAQMNMGAGTTNATKAAFKIEISGNNNLFDAQQNLNLNGSTSGDFLYRVEMTGYSNTMKVGTNGGSLSFRRGATEGTDGTKPVSTGGRTEMYFKGSDAANKNQFVLVNPNFVVDGIREIDNSTNKVSIIFDGNTVLSGNGTKGSYSNVTLKLHENGGHTYMSGETRFEVNNAGNELYFNEWKMGNTISTGGSATFSVRGGGSTIKVAGNSQITAGVGSTVDNIVGGALEFHVDDTGISSIDFSTDNYSFTGILIVDFSEFLRDADNERFVLMTSTTSGNNFKNALTSIWFDATTGEIKGNVDTMLADTEDALRFAIEGNAGDWQLVAYYTHVVPEPATYAAIFGAIALGLATYRRKNKR